MRVSFFLPFFRPFFPREKKFDLSLPPSLARKQQTNVSEVETRT